MLQIHNTHRAPPSPKIQVHTPSMANALWGKRLTIEDAAWHKKIAVAEIHQSEPVFYATKLQEPVTAVKIHWCQAYVNKTHMNIILGLYLE